MNVGDRVWIYNIAWNGEQTLCPVCAGTRVLEVRPAHSAAPGTQVACEYCNAPTPGYVTDHWGWKLTVRQVTIDGKKEETGQPTEYRANTIVNGGYRSWTPITPETAYGTENAARCAGELELQKRTLRSEQVKLDMQHYKRSCAGWSVGYHLSNLRRLHDEAQYHANKLLVPPEEFEAMFAPPKHKKAGTK